MSTHDPFTDFRRGLDAFVDRFFHDWPSAEPGGGEMRMWDFDVQEKDNEVCVRAEMPGFDTSEIDVHVHDNMLTITAEHKEESEGRHQSSRFWRSVSLPFDVEADKVDGNYRNGVLELHIPVAESAKPKKVAIRGETKGESQNVTAQTGETSQAESNPEGE
jgi:HSP20 family protein